MNKSTKTIYKVFKDVAMGDARVDELVDGLLDGQQSSTLSDKERLSLQAFCCALLADEAKNFMQAKQYLEEFVEYLNNAFNITGDDYVPRLIRYMVESRMHDAEIVSHTEEDIRLLDERKGEIADADLRSFVDELLKADMAEETEKSEKSDNTDDHHAPVRSA